MKPIIFLGPTLPQATAMRELDAVILAPAAQGDVYRAALKHPPAIGIIDGYFDRVPAVWHKEILWAMAQGIHVFGSSSMGALRAAELVDFGMKGVGWIFNAFERSWLEDDDEVALIHGTAETGYQNLSEPMVNLRRTIESAVEEKIISSPTADLFLSIAKRLFYPDRIYANLLNQTREAGAAPDEIEALQTWLPTGRIDQKRLDAIEMLRVMKDFLSYPTQPMQVSYSFNHTDLWEQVTQQAGVSASETSDDIVSRDDLLDELRLNVDHYAKVYNASLCRLLLIAESQRQSVEVDEESLYNTIVEFRIEQNLLEPEDLEAWLAENHLDQVQFIKLMIEATRAQIIRASLADRITTWLPNELRLNNQYAHYVKRALEKRLALASSDLADSYLIDTDVSDATPTNDQELIQWFTARWPQMLAGSNLAATAQTLGFDSTDQLVRAIKREWMYYHANPQPALATPETSQSR
jgi:hypothetical protein